MKPLGLPLNKSNFIIGSQNKLKLFNIKSVPGMLLVYADWCGHCKKFTPVYNDMVTKIHNQFGAGFTCAIIDSSNFTDIPESIRDLFYFNGYPSLYFFDQNGYVIGKYTGQRTTESIFTELCNKYNHCVKYH